MQRSLRRWLVCWQRWRRGDFFARGSGILSWLSSACGDRFKQQVNDGLKHGMAQGRELSALILLIFLPVFGGQTIHRTWQNCHFLKSGFLLRGNPCPGQRKMAARSVARPYRTLRRRVSRSRSVPRALEIDSAFPGPPQGRGRRYQPALQKGAGLCQEAYRRISLRGLIGCAQIFTPKTAQRDAFFEANPPTRVWFPSLRLPMLD